MFWQVKQRLELIHLRKVITFLFDFVLLIDHIIVHFNDFMIWIYFDEIFILFLLLFLISWFHVCGISFSGTGVDEPKKVSFEFLDVPDIHWQHLVAKKIPISESTTFLDFRRRVRTSFSEEITTKIFRVYKKYLTSSVQLKKKYLLTPKLTFKRVWSCSRIQMSFRLSCTYGTTKTSRPRSCPTPRRTETVTAWSPDTPISPRYAKRKTVTSACAVDSSDQKAWPWSAVTCMR